MSRFTAVMVAVAGLALAIGAGSAFGQLGDGSIGTVQVTPPPVDIQIDPVEGVGVTTSVATPAGDAQTAGDSVGTMQAAAPGATGGASASPSQTGTGADPNASFSAGTSPASGGPQTADSSVGTAQIGGAGSQSAANSVGTAQVAQPGIQAGGSVQGPLRPDMPDGAVTPEAGFTANVDPAQSGPQSADGSAGTVQVGGGSQTARNSTGTAQIAVPSVASSAGAGGSPTSSPDGSVRVTPSGGPQTAEGSTGVLQIGGGSGGAPGGDGSSSGAFFAVGGASVAEGSSSTGSAQEDALPTAAQPLSVERNAVPLGGTSARPLAAAARRSTLPFTGVELGFVVLFALALLVSGYTLRRVGTPRPGALLGKR